METKKGTIVFIPYATGTKSEMLKPFLYECRSSIIPLWKKGDNPFQNDAFNDYDGKYVIIKGNFNKNIFEVESIITADREC